MLERLNSRGDTIIEVMLATATLSVILAGAYTLTSHAARIGQAAKERTQAVAYAQQQAEIIQAYALRDWEALLADLPNEEVTSHFDPSDANWRIRPGALTYSPNQAAANYRVATVLDDRECSPATCSSSSSIKQLTFRVEVDWLSAIAVDDPGGNPVRDSTRLIVKVSPAGQAE